MENKRFLKIFGSRLDYESQKESVMGEPYVVLLEDTQDVIFYRRDYSKEYFTIEALESGSVGLSMPLTYTSYSYRVNGGSWVEATETVVLDVAQNDKIEISCVSESFADFENVSSLFSVTNQFNVYGNTMSLIYGDEFEGQEDLGGHTGALSFLLLGCSTLVNAIDLILPANTLSEYCYVGMFYGCTSLVSSPELPATALADSCNQYV